MIRHILGLAAALLLSGCGAPEQEAPPPSPLLYEIASADGVIEGWLLGTIHALPDGTEWRTEPISEVIGEADVLVVEVAQLGDSGAASKLFAERSNADAPVDPVLRVPPARRSALLDMMADGGLDAAALRRLDTWAVALVLAQSVRHGEADNGVDRALIAEFADRGASVTHKGTTFAPSEIIELEGLAFQFDLFDKLPEREQRDLLAAVVRDHQRWRDNPGHLTRKWLAGDAEALIDPEQSSLLADAELREALLTRRNAAWVEPIVGLLEEERGVLVAVGAAHLPGPDGLAALLEGYGYTVRPIR